MREIFIMFVCIWGSPGKASKAQKPIEMEADILQSAGGRGPRAGLGATAFGLGRLGLSVGHQSEQRQDAGFGVCKV